MQGDNGDDNEGENLEYSEESEEWHKYEESTPRV